MKLFGSKVKRRILSWTFLVVFLNSLFIPMETAALTSGPHQPEYTSYEDAGATDMVNLLTGDFSLNMPILSVPIGSEGTFPVPLSYHGGVGLDMEASWVGLGWNINVGSLTRSINGFPDDANAESQSVQVKDAGSRGWYSRGIGASMGWDSQVGHYGVVNIGGVNTSWVGDKNTYGISQLSFGDGGNHITAEEVALTAVDVVAAVLSYGTSTIITDVAMDVVEAVQYNNAFSNIYARPQASRASGYWKYSKTKDHRLFHTNYWIWLDQTRIEEMYGTLYLDKAQTETYNNPFARVKVSVNKVDIPLKKFAETPGAVIGGAASDINIDFTGTASYIDNLSPTALAYDNYSVNAPGISGNIKPYRFEMGSVSVPRPMTASHIRLAPLPFMDYGTNKVPFVYANSLQNGYYHHVGASPDDASITSPSFFYGLDVSSTGLSTVSTVTDDEIMYKYSDFIFGSAKRTRQDVSTNSKLTQGNLVQWLTNAEIRNTTGKFTNTPYIDYFSGAARTQFRTSYDFGGKKSFLLTTPSSTLQNGSSYNKIPLKDGGAAKFSIGASLDLNISIYDVADTQFQTQLNYLNYVNATVQAVNNTAGDNYIIIDQNIAYTANANYVIDVINKSTVKPDHSIGAYVVTSPDGMNYHFSIPVYDYDFMAETIAKNDVTKKSTISRFGAFANTWLLTAITGPDYVDRGGANNSGDGILDENDWGYWVKFNYGMHRADYNWRLPYESTKYQRSPDDLYESYSKGVKEKYYLNSIETKSHVALFLKGNRNDAKDASAAKKASLRLCEIALLTKYAYKQLVDPAGAQKLLNCSGTKNVVYQYSGSTTGNDITAAQESFIQNNALRRIIFNSGKTTSASDYSLCTGALNSDAGYGKLTLNRIAVLGRNNSKIFPDYKFGYGENRAYDANKWDGWGMYSSYGTVDGTSHATSVLATDGRAWLLDKVTTPEGSQIQITHEMDRYASVFGTAITEKKGGNGRVASVKLVDPNGQSYGTRYLYNNDDGTSSGVVSQEPDYINTTTEPFYVPFTPVMYGKVSVLSGKLTSDVDYSSKQVFEFETPHKSMISVNTDNKIMDKVLISNYDGQQSGMWQPKYKETGSLVKYQITTNTQMIGKVKSIKVMDKNGTVVSQQNMYYSNNPLNSSVNNYQGYFTEGTLMHEVVNGSFAEWKHHKMQRTTILDKPYTIQKVVTTNDGFTVMEENKSWDFYTGMVVETHNTDAFGLKFKTVLEPLYTISNYTELGSKVLNSDNKNMMTQIGATYTYRLDDVGNQVGLIGASATVWSKDWSNYRNIKNGNYESSAELDLNNDNTVDADEAKNKVWRKSSQYIWKGEFSRLKPGGIHSFTPSDKFNFTTPNTVLWQKAGGIERYNHASIPLETKDFNNLYSSSKLGYNDRLLLNSAVNSKYEETAFSSAEDLNSSTNYFGGEVFLGTTGTTLISFPVHTGKKAIQVTSGYGFVFKSSNAFSNNGISANKTYRASVWTNSNTNGKIYYKINNGAETIAVSIVSPPVVLPSGTWYRVDANIAIGNIVAPSIEIGVKSANGSAVVFDDFRFQPFEAAMKCYVYNPLTLDLEYVLDNDNLYTRYEYNDRGMLIKTYAESIKFKYGTSNEKLVSETKVDYKRFYVDQ